ncbi:response regulator [Maricaulaceae bacterium MS644]
MIRELTVLHVEDDFADAMLFQHALNDAGDGSINFEMEVARTLRDARLKLARRRYDFIIADLRLPDSRDPNDTVSLIKRHAQGAPIVVLTGSARVDEERIGAGVIVLDKNSYFHNRDDSKSRALLRKVLEATETSPAPVSAGFANDQDDDDTLML